jgi:hypothetical protein
MDNPFEGLYDLFIGKRSSKLVLSLFNAATLINAMIITAAVRRYLYSSLDLRIDIVAGILIGLTILTSFNCMVYFGSLNKTDK